MLDPKSRGGGGDVAWIKRGALMVDLNNLERLDKRRKDGSLEGRIVGWVNEGVVQIPLLNTYWCYDALRRVHQEWFLKRHPDMVVYEGDPAAADALYRALQAWLAAPNYRLFDVDYELERLGEPPAR